MCVITILTRRRPSHVSDDFQCQLYYKYDSNMKEMTGDQTSAYGWEHGFPLLRITQLPEEGV